MSDLNLVLFSRMAFYPMHWEAFRYLCRHYQVSGAVITREVAELPSVHRQLGIADPTVADFPVQVLRMPAGGWLRRIWWLCRQLRTLRPDAIWVQEEPNDPFLFAMLAFFTLRRKPRIACSVCENIFSRGTLLGRSIRHLLWHRLDRLLAVAKPSIAGIRLAGMPTSIPTSTLVAGALSRPEQVEPLPFPFTREPGDFVVGFVGRICEEKGWKVLLQAITDLPASIKCVLIGDGPQLQELDEWLKRLGLCGRVAYMGLLPRDQVWRFHAMLDVLVLPSLTFPQWKEQFGGVLADGMASGLPLIGSDSGAIPEVIGPAGLIVPEGDAAALAAAIRQLAADPELRRRLGAVGRKRFHEEFDIPAYAGKIAIALGLERME